MKKAASFALGCKVNQYESEAIAELFAEKGYEIVGIDEEADVYVINTCTVTNFGDKKSRQLIRKVKRQNENAIVAVVGCYAQTAPKELMEIAGVNLVIGTKDRAQIVEMVEQYDRANGVENHVSDIMKERVFEPLSIQKLANRTRAYLKIQDGCSQYCSYCIIPYARGPIRSREPQEVVAEVKRLAENGFKEVVLTGIHVASYGKDRRDTSLLDILKQVHEVEGIERIRFSSIEPNVVTEEFAQTMAALPKVCDHFHLSLQSGCDRTLKNMNRRYSAPEYAEKCIEALRKITGWDIKLAEDLVGATSDTSAMVGYSSAMRRVAVKMNKICNDLRLLASGPRCGLGEINLPAMQPGSSIMPGKVNPVIPEVMNQVSYKVIGNDLCVAMSGEAAQMELNAMEPVMAQCCFESADLLMNGFDTLRTLCIDGITANEEVCRRYVHDSIGVVTALNPVIGYKNSTKIAKEALETGRGVYELVLEHGILSKKDLDTILKPENMIKPVKLDIKSNK